MVAGREFSFQEKSKASWHTELELKGDILPLPLHPGAFASFESRPGNAGGGCAVSYPAY